MEVGVLNLAPTVLGESRIYLDEDTPLSFTSAELLANDFDVDGDLLELVSVEGAVNGSVVLEADGTVTFTPDLNYAGPAEFGYTVSDGTCLLYTSPSPRDA